MCACVCLCECVVIYVCMCVSMCMCICVFMCVYMCVFGCVWVCMYVCARVCVWGVCVCERVYVYVLACVCWCVVQKIYAHLFDHYRTHIGESVFQYVSIDMALLTKPVVCGSCISTLITHLLWCLARRHIHYHTHMNRCVM